MKTIKLNSAFTLNLAMIAFFAFNGFMFDLMIFYIIAGIYLMLLPACSTTK